MEHDVLEIDREIEEENRNHDLQYGRRGDLIENSPAAFRRQDRCADRGGRHGAGRRRT